MGRYVVEAWGTKGIEELNRAIMSVEPSFSPFTAPKNFTGHFAAFVVVAKESAENIWKDAEFYGTFSITPATRL